MAEDTRVRKKILSKSPFLPSMSVDKCYISTFLVFQVICYNICITLPLFFLLYYMVASLLSGAFK